MGDQSHKPMSGLKQMTSLSLSWTGSINFLYFLQVVRRVPRQTRFLQRLVCITLCLYFTSWELHLLCVCVCVCIPVPRSKLCWWTMVEWEYRGKKNVVLINTTCAGSSEASQSTSLTTNLERTSNIIILNHAMSMSLLKSRWISRERGR